MACGSCGNVNCNGCSNCAQTVTCPQTVLTPVECGVRPCSPLANCTSLTPATPNPYYNCTDTCEESHCQQINNFRYATAICTTYAFNIPGCGQSANLYFADVKVLPVGAYIWHADYGYFEIVAFNSQTGQATIVNHCNEDNAEVGTNVPACTCFVVTPIPAPDNDPTLFPFVAVDFTAPAVGNCLDITVTSVNGLAVGGAVGIGDGIYRLEAVLSPTLITICNDGDGITPGTVVIAQNDAGEYQYPIIQIGVNPCSVTAGATGAIVVCDAGALKPLDGSVLGQIPVLQNITSNIVQFIDPCTAVASCLPLPCDDYENRGNALQDVGANSSGLLDPPNIVESDMAGLTINNTSACRVMYIRFITQMYFKASSTVLIAPVTGTYLLDPQFRVNGGPYQSFLAEDFVRTWDASVAGVKIFTEYLTFSSIFQVNPGNSVTFEVKMGLQNVAGGTLNYTQLNAVLDGLAIAV